jgi:hypothetical protein
MNSTTHPAIGIVLGVGIGILITVGLQSIINKRTIATCYEDPHRQLVLLRSIIGDSYYCVESKYLPD